MVVITVLVGTSNEAEMPPYIPSPPSDWPTMDPPSRDRYRFHLELDTVSPSSYSVFRPMSPRDQSLIERLLRLVGSFAPLAPMVQEETRLPGSGHPVGAVGKGTCPLGSQLCPLGDPVNLPSTGRSRGHSRGIQPDTGWPERTMDTPSGRWGLDFANWSRPGQASTMRQCRQAPKGGSDPRPVDLLKQESQ